MTRALTRAARFVRRRASQVVVGYALMLAAMSYSVEIFACVVGGLALGHAVFNLDLPPAANTDPCCAFKDDENAPDAPDGGYVALGAGGGEVVTLEVRARNRAARASHGGGCAVIPWTALSDRRSAPPSRRDRCAA